MLILVFFACSGQARAETVKNQAALAESLFQQGRRLMAEGDLDRACNALEASLELDRAVGTLLNLALCYEKQGLVASAWSMFVAAEQEALAVKQKRRAALARKHHLQLAQRVPKVVFDFEGPLGGVEFQLDGKKLSADTLGLELPLDPGTHTIVAERDDGAQIERSFTSAEAGPGETSLQEITLGPLPPRSAEEEPRAASSEAKEEAIEHDEQLTVLRNEPPQRREPQVGWLPPTIASVGAVGVITGVTLGFVAVDQAAEADCDENDLCSEEGKEDREKAIYLLDVGYTVGISGGVVAAAGLVWWVWSSWSGQKRKIALRTGVPGAGPWGFHLRADF